MRLRLIAPLAAALSLLSAAALAQEAPSPPPAAASPAPAPASDAPALLPPAAAPLRQLSLTMSPLHLILPVFEVTAEYALQPKVGVALIAGYGSVKANDLDASAESIDVFEIGAQARYYLLGDFEHGLQLGAEAVYLKASTSTSSSGQTIQATGEGLSAGAFIGYKVVSSMGFTFDAQLGQQYAGVGAKATSSSGQSASTNDASWSPLLNLNVGWTL